MQVFQRNNDACLCGIDEAIAMIKESLIRFGNKYFRDVTNETTAGEIFSYEEARHYGETGEKVVTS